MKKFVIFALAVLIAFAMCSCQPTADNFEGTVPFRLDVGGARAKALTATDARLTAIKEVQLKFTAKNQSNPVGESSDWESGLIDYDNTTGKGTWDGGDRYLSQGQWLVEAQALDDNDVVIFEGSITVYVSKVINSATVMLTPAESTTAKGLVHINELESNAVFEETKDYAFHRIALNIYDIEGAKVGDTKYVNATDAEDGVVNYEALTAFEMAQGSYTITAQIEQNQYTVETDGTHTASTTWVKATGGSAVDFMVINDETTEIDGSVKTSEYITLSTDTIVDINSEIGLSLKWTADAKSGKFEVTATLPVGSTTTLKNVVWFVDGEDPTVKAYNTDKTLSVDLPYGEYAVSVYVNGTTESGQTIKSEMLTWTLKSADGTSGWTWSAN